MAAGKRRICRANGSSGESAARLSAVRGLAWDGRSCQVALANLLLPNRSCQIDEVIVAQPAAAAVADRAPNRNRPSDAPPITTRVRPRSRPPCGRARPRSRRKAKNKVLDERACALSAWQRRVWVPSSHFCLSSHRATTIGVGYFMEGTRAESTFRRGLRT